MLAERGKMGLRYAPTPLIFSDGGENVFVSFRIGIGGENDG